MKPDYTQRGRDALTDDGIVFVVATAAAVDCPSTARVRLRRVPAVERREELVDTLTAATTRYLDGLTDMACDSAAFAEAIRAELAALLRRRLELRPTIFVLVLEPRVDRHTSI